jgi:leucyl-tRNA synthetase
MDELHFNTAIAKLIELNNAVTKLHATPREVAEPMVAMLAPLVPHIAEELWSKLGHGSGRGRDDGGTITYVDFPVADPSLLVDDTVELPIQINGKVRSRVSVATDANKATIEAAALADPKVIEALAGGEPKKLIVVPGRMINIVV